MSAIRRKCTNPACSTHGLVVTTAATKCIGCGHDLRPDRWIDTLGLGDLVGTVFKRGHE